MFVRASCVTIAGIAAVEAFTPTALLHPTTSSRGVPAVSMVARGGDSAVGRRQAFALLSTLPLVLGSVSPAEAKKAAIKLNSEGQPETPEERRERIKHSPSRTHSDHPFRPIRRSGGGRKMREEEAERRAALDAKEKELMAGKEFKEAELGSNLRGDYYYPTARKRYLPRVKRAFDEIQELKAQLTTDPKWDIIGKFIKGPGDIGSAMTLYVSAASGGGLSINAKFFSDMKAAAGEYDGALGTLKAALGKKDSQAAYDACEGLEAALLAYRTAGKPMGLQNDDWGVGEIPDCKRGVPGQGAGKLSSCSVGSSFGNANPNLYQRNIKQVEQ